MKTSTSGNTVESEPPFHIIGRVHLAITNALDHTVQTISEFAYITIQDKIQYVSFTDDFGPMNLGSTYQFCSLLENALEENIERPVALLTLSESKSLTNAVFLLGAYMIMKLDSLVQEVESRFYAMSALLVPYKDVTPGAQNFNLHVQDCWRGLIRSKQLGWVDFGLGGFDLEEYLALDSPLNADMHEIVPGKFLAMRGPRDIASGALWEDVASAEGTFSHRDFSPAHYAEILVQFNVQAVVRLNAPQYDKRDLAAAGIALADLYFDDCTPPPVDIVAKFLALAEALPGALAVHCQAGLGRTGTLIALYMMKHHGFTAREAMGWLRIVRPGSVIGKQQDFLCAREATMRKDSAPLRPGIGLAAAEEAGGVEAVQRLIDATVRVYDARYRAAVGQAGGGAPPGGGCGDDGERLAVAAHVTAATNRRNGARSWECVG